MKEKIFSKLLAVTLAFVMVFTGVGVGQWEPEQAWAETVIEVSSKDELAQIEQTAGTYKLVADIALESGGGNYTPADGAIIDGNGYTITLNGKPLFNMLNKGTVIKNLTLKGSVTESESYHVGALARISNAEIRNCANYASVTYTNNAVNQFVGGLVGLNRGTISNSISFATIENGKSNIYGSIGNLEVPVFDPVGKIENCFAKNADRIGSVYDYPSSKELPLTDKTYSNNNAIIDDTADLKGIAAQLNETKSEGDLSWSVEDGILAPRGGNGGTDTPETDASAEEIEALNSAIESAKTVDTEKLYTSGTWSSFSDALTKAENVKAGTPPL